MPRTYNYLTLVGQMKDKLLNSLTSNYILHHKTFLGLTEVQWSEFWTLELGIEWAGGSTPPSGGG